MGWLFQMSKKQLEDISHSLRTENHLHQLNVCSHANCWQHKNRNPLCLRCSWQPTLFFFFYKYIYIVDFTCSAFSVPSHHSVFGTVIVSWCASNSKTSASDPTNNLSLWCLAAQMLSDKAKAHPCFETCPLSPCDWMNLRAFVLFFVFSERKFRSFGCICPHCSNFFFKVLDIGTVFRCAEIFFFMLEALSVVFIFFNNPIRNRVLILVWISHNLIKKHCDYFLFLLGSNSCSRIILPSLKTTHSQHTPIRHNFMTACLILC